MLRAGKGTMQRKMTVDLYTTELDTIYEANTDSANVSTNGTTGPVSVHDSVQDIVNDIIATSTGD